MGLKLINNNYGKIFFAMVLFAVIIFSSSFSFADSFIDKKIDAAVRTFIFESFPDLEGEEINIKFTKDKEIKYAEIDAERVEFSVFDGFRISKLSSKMSIPITMFLDGVDDGKINLSVNLEVLKDVVVAKEKIKKGTVIQAASLGIEKNNITTISGNYYSSKEEIEGRVAKGNILQNTVIRDWMFKEEPLVKRGESVKIIARNNGVLVQSTGKAMEDGAKGKMVKVKREGVRTPLECEVTGKGVVEVKI